MTLPSSPSPATISRKAERLKKELFMNGGYYYHMKDIIKLFNQLGSYDQSPNTNKNLLWGSCIEAVVAIKDFYDRVGTRGSFQLHTVKQCMIAAMAIIDDNQNVRNRKLLTEILPHTDNHCRNEYFDKCIKRRILLDTFDEPEFFCETAEYQRDS